MSTVEVEVLRIGSETDDAVQVFVAAPSEPDGERAVWLPFSHVHEINRSNPPTLRVSRWLAEKEDL